MSPTKKFKF